MMESESDKRSLVKREEDILSRLKEAREFLRLSQTEFSERIGISRERLASYEAGRAPLRWEIALRVCRHFFISELWLATGILSPAGEPKFGRLGDDPDARASMSLFTRPTVQRLKMGMLFSEAFDKCLRAEYEAVWTENLGWPPLVFSPGDDPRILINAMAVYVELSTFALPIDYLVRFYAGIIKAIIVLTDQIGMEDYHHGHEKVTFTVALEDFLENHLAASGGGKRQRVSIPPQAQAMPERKGLTISSEYRNIQSMKSPIEVLLDRVSLATNGRGAKAALAKFLKVPPPRVSDWLRGNYEPSGDVALRLLEWVTAEEAKQQSAPGSVITTARSKTRSTQHSHEKIKQVRKRR